MTDHVSAVVSAVAAVVAIIAAVVTWLLGRRDEAQRLSTSRQWEVRSDLYIDLMVWARAQSATIERLQSSAVPQDETQDGLVRMAQHFEPPPELYERVELFASREVRQALKELQGAHLLSALVDGLSFDEGFDVKLWVRALDGADAALGSLRTVVATDVEKYVGPLG